MAVFDIPGHCGDRLGNRQDHLQVVTDERRDHPKAHAATGATHPRVGNPTDARFTPAHQRVGGNFCHGRCCVTKKTAPGARGGFTCDTTTTFFCETSRASVTESERSPLSWLTTNLACRLEQSDEGMEHKAATGLS